jgi:hypothetical protein
VTAAELIDASDDVLFAREYGLDEQAALQSWEQRNDIRLDNSERAQVKRHVDLVWARCRDITRAS